MYIHHTYVYVYVFRTKRKIASKITPITRKLSSKKYEEYQLNLLKNVISFRKKSIMFCSSSLFFPSVLDHWIPIRCESYNSRGRTQHCGSVWELPLRQLQWHHWSDHSPHPRWKPSDHHKCHNHRLPQLVTITTDLLNNFYFTRDHKRQAEVPDQNGITYEILRAKTGRGSLCSNYTTWNVFRLYKVRKIVYTFRSHFALIWSDNRPLCS